MADQTTADALAAHPNWEWRDGMRPRDESPYTRITPQVAHKLAGPVARMAIGVVPDLEDDATAGILLGMVREWAHARGSAVEVFCGTQQSSVEAGPESGPVGGYGRTIGEAAGRCLLACWAVDAEHEAGDYPDAPVCGAFKPRDLPDMHREDPGTPEAEGAAYLRERFPGAAVTRHGLMSKARLGDEFDGPSVALMWRAGLRPHPAWQVRIFDGRWFNSAGPQHDTTAAALSHAIGCYRSDPRARADVLALLGAEEVR
jgi:hypothetical protein